MKTKAKKTKDNEVKGGGGRYISYVPVKYLI